jgi:ABC-type polysaccharide/polyol phosphate transport system ATPase subunit
MMLDNSSKSSIASSTQRFTDAAIEMRDVRKQFHIYQGHNFSMREFFIRKFCRVKQESNLSEFSLQDISLSIGYGETWALIGHNGAGKSTLLRLMAGIYWPNEGRVILRGRVAALIGWVPDCTPI